MTGFCLHCGKYLKGEELQCPECGQFTEKGVQSGLPQQLERKRNGWNQIIFGLLLVCFAIMLLI